MIKFKISLLAGAAVILLSSSLNAQTTIAGWTFENSGTATNLSPLPSTLNGAGASAASIGMTGPFISGSGVDSSDITLGLSADTGTNHVADLGQIWRIRATGGTGTNNGWSSQAPLGSQGAQFNVNTTGFGNIQVSFDWYATNQGEANLQLQYTDDGSTWFNTPISLSGSDAGATVMSNSSNPNIVMGSYVNGGTAGQEWFTGLTASISDLNAFNDPNFGIRMVNAATGSADVAIKGGTPLNNTSGNWRFDNVLVNGVQAVPEPGSFILGAGGLGLLAGFVRACRGKRTV